MKTNKKIRILVADDDPMVKLIWQSLNNPKYTVKVVQDGPEVLAINLLDTDIIFMDINMPTLNGIETTKIIRKQQIDKPIIGVTAHVETKVINECLAAGMNDLLSKPLFPQDLERVISASC